MSTRVSMPNSKDGASALQGDSATSSSDTRKRAPKIRIKLLRFDDKNEEQTPINLTSASGQPSKEDIQVIHLTASASNESASHNHCIKAHHQQTTKSNSEEKEKKETMKEGRCMKRKFQALDLERGDMTENVAKKFCRITSSYLDPQPDSASAHECHICNKRFSNHQALGGHMTSHTKGKMIITVKDGETEGSRRKKQDGHGKKPKVHRCKVCGKEFEIGQKLGGHMRAHYDGILTSAASSSKMVKGNAGVNSVSGTIRNEAPSDDIDLRLTLGPSKSIKRTAPYSSSSQSSEGASLHAAEDTDIRLTLGPSECIKSTAPYPSSSQSSEGASLHVAEDIDLRLTLGPSESSKSTAPNLSPSPQSSEGARNEVDRNEQAEEELTESRVFELYASVKMSL